MKGNHGIYKKKFILRNGQTILLRSARKEDAPALINCLKTTSGETSFLSRESDEINITKKDYDGRTVEGSQRLWI